MSTQIEYENRNLSDAILLFEIGLNAQTLQDQSEYGFSDYRLNKLLSTILRHWLLLQNTTKYAGIHTWLLEHAPYRYGEVVYRQRIWEEMSSPRFMSQLYLIGDVVVSNEYLHFLGVARRVDKTSLKSSKTFFYLADPIKYSQIKQALAIRDLDFELARQLAWLYSNLPSSDLAVLATCPTELDCYNAMQAEINLCLYDYERMVNVLKLPEDQHSMRVSQSVISDLLSSAFQCAREIGKKLDWYTSVPSVLGKVLERSTALGLDADITKVLKDNTGDGKPTKRLLSLVELRFVLLSLITLTSNLIDSSIGKYNPNPKKLHSNYMDLERLERIGVAKDLITSSQKAAEIQNVDILATYLDTMLQILRRYLIENDFISAEDQNKILGYRINN